MPHEVTIALYLTVLLLVIDIGSMVSTCW